MFVLNPLTPYYLVSFQCIYFNVYLTVFQILQVHNKNTLVSIVSSVILRRLDKKPDRVEISEEQLVQATMRAEELAAEVGRPLRVVGWYHSHPHITVWPSHVGKKCINK